MNNNNKNNKDNLTLYARDANEQVMAIYERETLFVFRSWLLPPLGAGLRWGS